MRCMAFDVKDGKVKVKKVSLWFTQRKLQIDKIKTKLIYMKEYFTTLQASLAKTERGGFFKDYYRLTIA